jgi:hypothetical protein
MLSSPNPCWAAFVLGGFSFVENLIFLLLLSSHTHATPVLLIHSTHLHRSVHAFAFVVFVLYVCSSPRRFACDGETDFQPFADSSPSSSSPFTLQCRPSSPLVPLLTNPCTSTIHHHSTASPHPYLWPVACGHGVERRYRLFLKGSLLFLRRGGRGIL